MSSPSNDLEVLLSRARAGENEAVRKVIDAYGPTLRDEVRRRLGQHLRTQFDSTDILQEVWMDFFTKRIHQQTFHEDAELLRYLAAMARNAVMELQRSHLYTRKRDFRCQVPLYSSAVSANHDLVDRRPGPEKRAADAECWDQMLKRLGPRARRAVEMLRAGCSRHEVAEGLGVSDRIVRRVLAKARG